MKTKDEQARWLANSHYETESGISEIFRVIGRQEDRTDEPIKLLEVNRFTVSAGILPLQFGAAPEIGLETASIIIEVTPDEFQQIQRRELPLPQDWAIGDLLPRPARNGVA